MAQLDPRTSRTTTLAVVVSCLISLVLSIRARGVRRTLLFLLPGLALPTAGEYHAINRLGILRHHLQPQVKGLPFAIGLGWYTTSYNTFVLLESLAEQHRLTGRRRHILLPLATALTATSLDLVVDVALLDQGYWEWRDGGPYAREISGPNGQQGIPLANYSGWLALVGTVTALYLVLEDREHQVERPDPATSSMRARQAALILVPQYLGAVVWELRRRRWRHIAYSLLFPIVLVWACFGRRR